MRKTLVVTKTLLLSLAVSDYSVLVYSLNLCASPGW